mmetsp:Transcript_69012/g.125936  ORF Transcript_69012/g.125936 Transcript_69012/m.125936 type:complete len:250 (+) Transcript_69012:194-943(+)
MQFHELCDVKLRLLDNLHLPDQDVFQWVNALSLLLDLFPNSLRNELLYQIAQWALSGLGSHDVSHLLADLANLCRLGIAVRLDLVLSPLCECNHEHAHNIAIGGLHIHMCLDQSAPLTDQRAAFVTSDVQAMEICQAVAALNVLNAQPDLLECLILIAILEISQIDLKYTPLQLLRRYLGALCSGNQGLTALARRENAWSLDVIPFLLQERVTLLLLATFLTALREPLVLSNSHCSYTLLRTLHTTRST